MNEQEIRFLVRQLLAEGALDDLKSSKDFYDFQGRYKTFMKDLGMPTKSRGWFETNWKNGLGHDAILGDLKNDLDKFRDQSLEKVKDVLGTAVEKARGDSEVADTADLAKVESFEDWLTTYKELVKNHPQKSKEQEILIPQAENLVKKLSDGKKLVGKEFKVISSLGVKGLEGNPKKILFDLMKKIAAEKEKSDSDIDDSAPIEDQVEQVQDNIGELENGMEQLDASLDTALKKNPPPEPTDAEKMNKSRKKFDKYIGFLVNRLFRKLADYAEEKNRSDFVQIVFDNISAVTAWNHKRREVLTDIVGKNLKLDSDENITKESWKEWIGWYEQGIVDIAKIVKNIQADPFKKLDAKKITEGFDNYQNVLLEKRTNKQILEFFKTGQ